MAPRRGTSGPRPGASIDRETFLAALEYGVSPVVPWWVERHEPEQEEA